jgi:transketolase
MRNKCLDMIHQLSKIDSRIVFIGSDLSPNLLEGMKKDFPDRFFMEGISEAHLVGMAAGLAIDGFIPFFVTIGSFLTRRAYEQIMLDVCLQDLPVRFIGIGGGLNYAPLGPTHQAIEDFSLMGWSSNMAVVSPCDSVEMEKIMYSTLDYPHPMYIRLGKGYDPIITDVNESVIVGKGRILVGKELDRTNITIISTGIMTHKSLEVSEYLKRDGLSVKVIHLATIKPLDKDMVLKAALGTDLLVTIEEHVLHGGLNCFITDALFEGLPVSDFPDILRLGLPNKFTEDYGDQESLLHENGLSVNKIYERVASKCKLKKKKRNEKLESKRLEEPVG